MEAVADLVAVETHQEQPEQEIRRLQARHKETMEQPEFLQTTAAAAVERALRRLV
jgi:hypothetical protein